MKNTKILFNLTLGKTRIYAVWCGNTLLQTFLRRNHARKLIRSASIRSHIHKDTIMYYNEPPVDDGEDDNWGGF